MPNVFEFAEAVALHYLPQYTPQSASHHQNAAILRADILRADIEWVANVAHPAKTDWPIIRFRVDEEGYLHITRHGPDSPSWFGLKMYGWEKDLPTNVETVAKFIVLFWVPERCRESIMQQWRDELTKQ